MEFFWSTSQYKELVYKDKLFILSPFLFSFHNSKKTTRLTIFIITCLRNNENTLENRSNATESFHKDLIFLKYIYVVWCCAKCFLIQCYTTGIYTCYVVWRCVMKFFVHCQTTYIYIVYFWILYFRMCLFNPLTANDELFRHENLTFLWTWILRWVPRSFATHASLCNALSF